MRRITIHILFLFIFTTVLSQEESRSSFRFSGQASLWGQFTPDIDKTLWTGGRYIPQINYELLFPKSKKIDFEASVNIFGDYGMKRFNDFDANGKIKPYRLWTRYYTSNMEFRAGLQKINFGSAQMLRPLMWFDKMDPRDPLQMTDGVWGGLFRYYLKNNTNIWLWGLMMNNDTKGLEIMPTAGDIRPEAGGRVQFPINRGETAFSYHTRRVELFSTDLTYEHRFGFDIRADVVLGLWFESSWTHLTKDFVIPLDNISVRNQQMTTIGADYTIGIGNGLGVMLEQMLYTITNKAFDFDNSVTFTAINFTYPVSLFGNANAILYYDWKSNGLYSFANLNYQIKDITLYLMTYWNPKKYALPMQSGAERFMGKGVQVMAVWNH